MPEDNRKVGKYITNLTRQEYILRRIAEEEEKGKVPPTDAVWVRTEGIYPGFLLRPEEVERLEEIIRSWAGGRLLEPVKESFFEREDYAGTRPDTV
ncbi:MAG: hypothetical protein Q4D62_11405 [Planctomycetia bacterium]|nr:hypothetical protein [Planctomycetia bacterium]